jgi:hypothetical protein
VVAAEVDMVAAAAAGAVSKSPPAAKCSLVRSTGSFCLISGQYC